MLCNDCPRNCNVDRSLKKGACNSYDFATVSKGLLHFWEEPCISGKEGSGAVFFSGCNLKCVFCQNMQISRGNAGKPYSPNELYDLYLKLINLGANNINLVTPTHFIKPILKSLEKPLPVPVIWNSSAYENISAIKSLKNKVQVFLPDLKYSNNDIGKKYSAVSDYFDVAKSAIKQMYENVGKLEFDEKGIIKKGVVIRHLILPEEIENSLRVIDWVSKEFNDNVMFSLMGQYTPILNSPYENLNRRVTQSEYDYIVDYLYAFGSDNGYVQELSSATQEYIPSFAED